MLTLGTSLFIYHMLIVFGGLCSCVCLFVLVSGRVDAPLAVGGIDARYILRHLLQQLRGTKTDLSSGWWVLDSDILHIIICRLSNS